MTRASRRQFEETSVAASLSHPLGSSGRRLSPGAVIQRTRRDLEGNQQVAATNLQRLDSIMTAFIQIGADVKGTSSSDGENVPRFIPSPSNHVQSRRGPTGRCTDITGPPRFSWTRSPCTNVVGDCTERF